MKRIAIAILGAVLIGRSLPKAALAGKEMLAARIAAFETNLSPDVLVQGIKEPAWRLSERMAYYRVPGLSIAVVRNGKVAWARGYGVRAAGLAQPVTPDTVFSVASVSKLATAVIAMRLVQQRMLTLDGNINRYLRRWHLPDSALSDRQPVTMRRLLSHTAGLSVHGFADFDPGATLPTLLDILRGRPPAKNGPVRVLFEPGSRFRYSGGGTMVAQLAIEDTTGMRFPAAAQAHLFAPLQLRRSTFQNPLPESFGNIAKAHDRRGSVTALPRGWQTMPELAASGLWTSATDLARLIIALSDSYSGTSDAFLDRAAIRAMMTRVAPGPYGVGPQLDSQGGQIRFFHSGSNDSYKAWVEGRLPSGDGLVILTNGARGQSLLRETRRAVARAEGWPWRKPPVLPAIRLPPELVRKRVGRYMVPIHAAKRIGANSLRVWERDGNLFLGQDGDPVGHRLLPKDNFTFRAEDNRNLRVRFSTNAVSGDETISINIGQLTIAATRPAR